MSLNQPKPGTNAFEGRESKVQVLPCVGRRELAADSRIPLRNQRIAEASHKDSLVEQQRAHLDRLGGLTQNDGNDRRFPRKRFEAQRKQLLAEVAGVVVESGHPLGLALDAADGGK